MTITRNHPKQQFIFLLRNDPTPKLIDALKRGIASVAARRSWTIQEPSYFEDEVSGASPSATMHGGSFEVYSALPPWGAKLPLETDRAHYQEVEEVVSELCRLSRDFGMSFQLQLDGTVVGGVRDGSMDRMLDQGLMQPWKQALRI